MSVAMTNVGSHGSGRITINQSEIDDLLSSPAAATPDWPYEGQLGGAAHGTMENTLQQEPPLPEFYEAADDVGAWAAMFMDPVLDDFGMTSFDFPVTETSYPQITNSPESIFNDPEIRHDVEQSLQGGMSLFGDFNDPVPDLSSSGYLSGTDQICVSPSSYFGSANTSPFEPCLDFHPDPFTIGLEPSYTYPVSSTDNGSPPSHAPTTSANAISTAAPYLYRCTDGRCAKTFRKEAQLKQHQRVHRKALVCEACLAESGTEHKFAQLRDLERHLRARHPGLAEETNVRSEVRECPHPGCPHRGRRDNVSRHYESKHGQKLKWKRGVAIVG